ncbi:nucleolar and coiled-body phosphoprotein 1-like [Cydia pomonella]|uniref:nucleolar and coiled-body phosphoprotein 1-like n=1 Tax=Cydia pomonella TaxID=82600 RepID=UPI002ADDD0E1|nr:nucleolar and coiled-body phosphoprotein 1-like [Cydia pomonella]
MKQNGVRLVQRKFAQGVPIPASSISVAPTPPERKPDPPYSPKNVYHNNMSARNLLDIVSMQNIHKHKQEPLVVLERLRDDEIPSPVVPNGRCVRPRIRVPLRRRKVKGNKGNMCLRSGKRKSTDAGKGPTKKRKKLSSESTDDIPLVYYFNNRPAKPHNRQHRQKDITVTDKKQKASIREKRTPAPKKTVTKERSDSTVDKPPSRAESKASDGSFTFKEPSSPARLSYRLFKKTAAAATARQLKKGLPKDARWSTLRSARAPSETRSIVRRLRNKVLLGKKPAKPAVRKPGPKTNKDDTPAPPGPSGFRVPRPPPSESSENTSKAGPSGFKAPRPPPTETIAAPPSSRRASLESIDLFLAVKEEVENSGRPCGMVEVFAPSYPPSPVPSNGVEDWCLPPAIKASRSLKSLSDISSDIIRLGTPPGWTATPEFQDPQSEGDLVRGKEIMDENIKKELEEIRFEVSDKIEMKSKKSSEKNNVSDNEDSGIDVRAKKNQNTNKAKTDKDSEKAGQKHERDKEDKKAGHKEGKKVGHKDDRDKEGKKVEQKDERDKEGKKIDQKDERAKEGKKVGQKDEKDKEGKKVGHQDDRDKEGKKVEQKDEREKEGKKVGQKDERDKEGKKVGQKDERDKEDKNTGQIDEGDNIEKKAGQSGEGDKLEKKAGHRNERDKEDKKAGEKNKRENDDISKPDDATKRIKGKGVGKKTVQKETRGRKPKVAPVKEKKTLPKRAAKAAPAQEEVATNTRLLRNSRDPPPPNPDVYEFDELEGSRPPSGLRRRNQPTPDPPAQSPESIRYMDICPTSSQLVKINTKKEEVGNVLSVSLVPKDDIYKKQKNWIDNLTNRPALLNKFFNCLPTELQNELGSLATEGTGREEAYLDEKAGTVLEAPTYYPTAEEFEVLY